MKTLIEKLQNVARKYNVCSPELITVEIADEVIFACAEANDTSEIEAKTLLEQDTEDNRLLYELAVALYGSVLTSERSMELQELAQNLPNQ